MAAGEPTRVLLIAAADQIDPEVIVGITRRAPGCQVRAVATAHEPGRLAAARWHLDGIMNLLVEHEIPVSGTIGPRDGDPLTVMHDELADWPADQAILLVSADDVAASELEVARHPVLQHGTPILVLGGTTPAAAEPAQA